MAFSIKRIKPRALAENNGAAARLRGWPQTCNPYRCSGTQAHKFYAWLRGWLKQRALSLGRKVGA